MPVARTIYTQGKVTMSGHEVLAQSVNWSLNRPKENVSALGYSTLQRVAAGPEIATVEVTFYPTGTGPVGTVSEAGILDIFRRSVIAAIPQTFAVKSTVGSIKNALLTSVRGEASVGAVPTVTASFVGIDDPASILAVADPSTNQFTTIATTETVAVNGSGCAQRASFDWAVPVEPITCLGKDIETGSDLFGNPPGTASISVEGTTEPGIVTQVDLGNFTFDIGSGRSVASSSANMAVGQLFATFNTVTEGIAINSSFTGA